MVVAINLTGVKSIVSVPWPQNILGIQSTRVPDCFGDTPIRGAAVMPRVRRFVRRQNARFTEETIFFSEEDPYKAAQFLFNQKKSRNPKTDDVRQD